MRLGTMNCTLHLMNHHPECLVSIGPVVGKGLTLRKETTKPRKSDQNRSWEVIPICTKYTYSLREGYYRRGTYNKRGGTEWSFTDEIAMHHEDVEQKRGEVFVQNGLSSPQSSNGGVVWHSVAWGSLYSFGSSSVSFWEENSWTGLVNLLGPSVKTRKE